jgi:hypothetical protein
MPLSRNNRKAAECSSSKCLTPKFGSVNCVFGYRVLQAKSVQPFVGRVEPECRLSVTEIEFRANLWSKFEIKGPGSSHCGWQQGRMSFEERKNVAHGKYQVLVARAIGGAQCGFMCFAPDVAAKSGYLLQHARIVRFSNGFHGLLGEIRRTIDRKKICSQSLSKFLQLLSNLLFKKSGGLDTVNGGAIIVLAEASMPGGGSSRLSRRRSMRSHSIPWGAQFPASGCGC